ncbi:hypothetical protein B0H13DRAFT_2077458 [Mycena leptocephala]|nr:hypothetical protein B0H13DRAFT_2077458 [Mycena leptocephala]
MRRGFWDFVRDQFTTQQPVVKADLTGKTIIVLGANTGLGFEAAKHFATMNPGRLIMACRSQNRGQAAAEKLQAATGYMNAELWIVDLADFESVKQFADKFEQDGNAAIDGWETALQISCLSTPLVALLLLPSMLKTAREHSTLPRLVVVSSEVHYWAAIDKSVTENPDMLKTMGSAEYCTPNVLLNLLLTRALEARLPPGTPLIINTVNPGRCRSEITRRITGIGGAVEALFDYIFAFSTEVGSRHLVWAALALPEDPEPLRGAFIHGCRVTEPSDFVISAQGVKVQDRLWDELVDILGEVDPRVIAIVNQHLSPVPA